MLHGAELKKNKYDMLLYRCKYPLRVSTLPLSWLLSTVLKHIILLHEGTERL